MSAAPPPEEPRVTEPIETPLQKNAPTGWAPAKHTLATTLIVIGAALAGILIVLYAWELPPFSRSIQITDNAYVRGQTTLISPQVSGYVVAVPVQDYETIKAHDVLAQIDDRIYHQRVDQARANLAAATANRANSEQTLRSKHATAAAQAASLENAKAQLLRAQADAKRVEELIADGSVSFRERDQTTAALRAAEAAVDQSRAAGEIAKQDIVAVEVGRGGLDAAVESAQAALKLAEIDLSNTTIRSPVDGQLGDVGVRVGQYVTAGTQLMYVVPEKFWVTANFKEAQTAHMAAGQPAVFYVDALAGARLTGRVERLAPATGSEFAVLKSDNTTGNFVKVAQRMSVRIAVDPDQPLAKRLRPGMSVEVEVDTRERPQR
ncbi:HlyD family secretion protein [Peristeroidobacter soli]|uniref:HlyD family secretion protein n=1 Tax=Peristeroidobacter soli TaxID=2497877 RepID=UPI00101B691A|nr:HlyD family secretion protein [Peristeroidobacter soli]